jgi:hypothetical protein
VIVQIGDDPEASIQIPAYTDLTEVIQMAYFGNEIPEDYAFAVVDAPKIFTPWIKIKIARIPRPRLVELTFLYYIWDSRTTRIGKHRTNQRMKLDEMWRFLRENPGEKLEPVEHDGGVGKMRRVYPPQKDLSL